MFRSRNRRSALPPIKREGAKILPPDVKAGSAPTSHPWLKLGDMCQPLAKGVLLKDDNGQRIEGKLVLWSEPVIYVAGARAAHIVANEDDILVFIGEIRKTTMYNGRVKKSVHHLFLTSQGVFIINPSCLRPVTDAKSAEEV